MTFFYFWDRKTFEIRNKSILIFEYRILLFNNERRQNLFQNHYVDSHFKQFSFVNRRIEKFYSEDQDMSNINSYDKIEESWKKILSKISHFVVKQSDFISSTIVDDFITNQIDQSTQDFTQFLLAKYFHELTTQQQENYRANVKKYKRKEKQIAKIIQKMLKINEAIRASIKTYIFSKLMFAFIKKILQILIIKYKKIDD